MGLYMSVPQLFHKDSTLKCHHFFGFSPVALLISSIEKICLKMIIRWAQCVKKQRRAESAKTRAHLHGQTESN